MFYLGCPEPAWIGKTTAPLFLARPRLARIRGRLNRAAGPWALDSGGFSELSQHGRWTITPAQYAAEVRRFVAEVGAPDFIAPQDWMCEPQMVARTGLSVAEHQARTVQNYLELRDLLPDLPLMPVIQGWCRGDYRRCIDLYRAAGVDLGALPRVGVGSVCRRSSSISAALILQECHLEGVTRLHGFGVKTDGLDLFGDELTSADSMAWSYDARRTQKPCPNGKRDCRNCLHYALAWRRRVLGAWPGHDLEVDDQALAPLALFA